jgi:hypothetical protein
VSSVINPVGPEEPSTYWRRRALVVVGILVVIWLLWLLVSLAFGSDDDSPSPAASPTPSPVASESAEPDASASPQADPSASASPSASPSPNAVASGPCRNGDIEVVAGTASDSAPVGSGLGLTMTVTTTGDEPCARDVGAGANELRITSGSVLVWSSDFCSPSTDSETTTLEPGTGWSTSVSWPGTVTAEDCPANQPAAQPGTYRVVARNGKVESEPVTFTVR